MESKHDDSREKRVEGYFHNKSNCEIDESEEENALESAEYETQDPFNDMGHIMLELTVEMNMTEEDSDDVPDLELFEPSVEINTDEKAEPEKNQEQNFVVADSHDSSPVLKHKNPRFTCRKCGFIANSSGTFTRHISVGHRGIKWSCKLCGYVTTVKHSMVRHIHPIHQGWRYQCPFCDHESTQKGGVKYHIKKKHPSIYQAPKWSSLAPVKPKDSSQIPGIDHMDINEMFLLENLNFLLEKLNSDEVIEEHRPLLSSFSICKVWFGTRSSYH